MCIKIYASGLLLSPLCCRPAAPFPRCNARQEGRDGAQCSSRLNELYAETGWESRACQGRTERRQTKQTLRGNRMGNRDAQPARAPELNTRLRARFARLWAARRRRSRAERGVQRGQGGHCSHRVGPDPLIRPGGDGTRFPGQPCYRSRAGGRPPASPGPQAGATAQNARAWREEKHCTRARTRPSRATGEKAQAR